MFRNRRVLIALALSATLSLLIAGTASASHAVLVQGSGTLKGTWHMDFDSGTFHATHANAQDMKLSVQGTTDNRRFLAPDPGSIIAKYGSTKPSYSQCQASDLEPAPIALSNLPNGTWLCLRTAEYHLVRFQLTQKHPYPGGVDLTFTTWK